MIAHFPLALLGKIYDGAHWMLKRALRPLYLQSHEDYLRNEGLGNCWNPVGLDFEISTDLSTFFSELEGRRGSRLAVRTTGIVQKRLEVTFTAHSVLGDFEDTIVVPQLDAVPRYFALPSIPPQELSFPKSGPLKGTKVRSYDWFEVAIRETSSDYIHRSGRFIPTYRGFSERWTRRWGQIWNLEQLEMGKVVFKDMLEGILLWSPFDRAYPDGHVRFGSPRKTIWLLAPLEFFSRIDLLRNAAYWILLVLGLLKLHPDRIIVTRWTAEKLALSATEI